MFDKQKFPLTSAAMAQIENSVKEFRQQLESKKYAFSQQKQAYKRNMAEKSTQIDEYNKVVAEALQALDNASKQIDMVLKENGSSNNHN